MTQHGVAPGMPGGLPDGPGDLPVLSLDTTTLRAEPGGQAQTTVKLSNPGQLVESYRLDVVGLDEGWWQVHPPEVALYPGSEETAVVVLTPPAAARAPERPLPFGVRAISTLDSSRSIVEEADLEVGRVFDLQGTIAPVTSRGRWSARHTVTFTNWGNTPVRLKLTATDKDGRLGFQLNPDTLSVPVGGSATARLRVRPNDPFLRGAPVHLPFQVRGEQPGAAAPAGPRSVAARAGVPDPTQPVLDGAVLHGPILSRGVIVALTAAVLAVVAALALLFRAGDVAGARKADAPPDAPTGVAAEPMTANVVRVAWTGSDRATGYAVQSLDGSQKVLKSDAVKGDVQSFDAKELEPKTQYCFRVVAVRGENLAGPASEPACVTTPDDRLEPPTDVEVVTGADGNGQVSWKGQERNKHTVLVDGTAAKSVEAGITSTSGVPLPAGRRCVQVVALRDDLSSPPSEETCVEGVGAPATTPPGQGGGVPVPGNDGQGGGATPTPSVTGDPGGGGLTGFAAMVGPPYQEQPQAEAGLQALKATGVAGADRARIVPASEFPSLQFPVEQTILVVVPDLVSEDAARGFCASLPEELANQCQPVRAGS
jgi:hypothetical protein